MTDRTVGLFTAVDWGDGKHRFAEASDKYFSYLGGRTVKVIDPISRDNEILCVKTSKSSSPPKFVTMLLTLLKVISLFTVIVPLIFAIGKAISRSGKEFKLQQSEEKNRLLSDSSSHEIHRSTEHLSHPKTENKIQTSASAAALVLPASPSIEAMEELSLGEEVAEAVLLETSAMETEAIRQEEPMPAAAAFTSPPSSPIRAMEESPLEERVFEGEDVSFGMTTEDESLSQEELPDPMEESTPGVITSPASPKTMTIEEPRFEQRAQSLGKEPSIVTEAVGTDSFRVVASPSIAGIENPRMGILTARYNETTVEEIKTLNSVDRTKKILGEEIHHLREMLESNPSERARLEKRIERCEWILEACNKYDGFDKPANVPMDDFNQWLGSWYFRALITDYFSIAGENATPEEYLAAYVEATKEFISAPVNFREQTMTCGDEAISFLRCGALYDPTNPYTNMQELRNLQQGGEEAIANKRKEILRIQQANKKNPRVVATTTFALMQLENIQETIHIREETLKRQALQVVWAQVEIAVKKEEQFPDGKLKIAHIGLLNEDNVGMDQKSGWYHHEGNEIQDMNSVYEFLHGKTIVFDGSGPLIAEDGSIHMPYSSKEGPPQVLLEAAFFNISIQGKLKHGGQLQNEINTKNSKNIRFKFPKRTSKGPNQCKTSVEHSTLLHKELEKAGFQTAISCLSGKDRTGWVAYQICLNKMESAGMKVPQGLRTAGFEILKSVLQQNYGKKILKVTKRWLKGVSKAERAKLGAVQMSDLATAPAKLRGRGGRTMVLSDAEDNVEILKSRKHLKKGGEASSSGSDSEASSSGSASDEMVIE